MASHNVVVITQELNESLPLRMVVGKFYTVTATPASYDGETHEYVHVQFDLRLDIEARCQTDTRYLSMSQDSKMSYYEKVVCRPLLTVSSGEAKMMYEALSRIEDAMSDKYPEPYNSPGEFIARFASVAGCYKMLFYNHDDTQGKFTITTLQEGATRINHMFSEVKRIFGMKVPQ